MQRPYPTRTCKHYSSWATMGGIAYVDWRLALSLAASRHIAVFLHEMAHLAMAIAVGRGKSALTARNLLLSGVHGAVYVPHTPHVPSSETSDAIIRHAGWAFSAALALCSSALLGADKLRATLCDEDSHSACCDERFFASLLATLQLALWWTAADACALPLAGPKHTDCPSSATSSVPPTLYAYPLALLPHSASL